jgi:hypothetical protein
MQFIQRWVYEEGALPTVIYPNRRINRYPCWLAPLGDVLRAADEARSCGFAIDMGATEQRLLAGQDISGGFQTATGFAAQAGGRPPAEPEVRDVMHVAGWCDKAFRYLAAHAGPQLPEAVSATFETPCTFQGRPLRFVETPSVIEIRAGRHVRYRWQKGERWAAIAEQGFWLR